MNFGLIVVGDEILSGKRQDQHFAKVVEILGARGLMLGWARYVGDDPKRITSDLKDAFKAAHDEGDVVFSCGGIGATPDDHTRQCAAAALGRPLKAHPQAHALILERMRESAAAKGLSFDEDDPNNIHRLNMAVFPEGAEIIPNPYNKIAGFSVKAGEGGVFFVPGFPVMAWPMIEWVLDHRFAHLHRSAAEQQQERSVIVFGGVEGSLTPLMLEIEKRFAPVKIFSLPNEDHPQWGRHVELGVKGLPSMVGPAYQAMLERLQSLGCPLGPELVR